MFEGNPALKRGVKEARYAWENKTFGWTGTSVKTIVLTAILLCTFAVSFTKTTALSPTNAELQSQATVNDEGERDIPVAYVPSGMQGYFWASLFIGFGVAMIIIFNPKVAPVLSWFYAGLEGIVLGTITACLEVNLPGIGWQAGGLTLAVLFVMWAMYTFRIIKVTPQFTSGVIAATGAICLIYIVSLLLDIFTGHSLPLIHEAGLAGILVSVVIVAIAALNLCIDFYLIDELEQSGAPKYMEWYCAFSLMVTLVWLYLEVLRLLAKLRSSNN